MDDEFAQHVQVEGDPVTRGQRNEMRIREGTNKQTNE